VQEDEENECGRAPRSVPVNKLSVARQTVWRDKQTNKHRQRARLMPLLFNELLMNLITAGKLKKKKKKKV